MFLHILSVKSINKIFRNDLFRRPFKVLDHVDFEVVQGESFGLIGLNGSGKSTTIKIILGIIYPDLGKVEVFGRSPREFMIKRKISYLPENPVFYEGLTGEEFLKFVGSLRGIKGKKLKNEIEKWLYKVGLENEGQKLLKKFSRGMIQRIGLAQAFLGSPELIILDEPLNGLDPLGRKMARDLIKEALNNGATVFFTSHILEDIEKICDRVAILHRGKILKFIDLKDFKVDLEEEFVKTVEEYEKSN